MRQDIHDYFRIGTLQWMSFPGQSLSQTVRQLCQDEYFDVLELAPTAPEERGALRALLDSAAVDRCCGVQPAILSQGLNPNALAEEERLRAQRRLLQAVDEAAELGAEGISFLAGKWQEQQRAQAVEQLLKTTVAVCRYGAQRGVQVELEVFDYDVDKAALIGPAPLAAEFAAQVRRQTERFGLLVDLSHIPLTHESSAFAVSTMARYITHFHIGNAVTEPGFPNYGDQHPRFAFPHSANGEAELTDFLRVLRENGFFRSGAEKKPILSFEVKPFGTEEPQLVLAGCKRCLRRAWAALEEELPLSEATF